MTMTLRRVPDPQKLPDFNPQATCSKCGGREITVRYRTDLDVWGKKSNGCAASVSAAITSGMNESGLRYPMLTAEQRQLLRLSCTAYGRCSRVCWRLPPRLTGWFSVMSY